MRWDRCLAFCVGALGLVLAACGESREANEDAGPDGDAGPGYDAAPPDVAPQDAGRVDAADADTPDANTFDAEPVIASSGGCDVQTVHPTMDPPYPPVRVVGVYEPPMDGATIDVRVELSEPSVLVLLSFDPARWHVEQTHEGSIERIVTNGPRGNVDAPAGVAVESDSRLTASWDYHDERTRELEEQLEFEVGPIASFHGCYDTGEFTLAPHDEWVGYTPPPDCDAADPPEPFGPPSTTEVPDACGDALSDSTFCMMSGGETRIVGLDSGASCSVAPYGVAGALSPNVAWLGNWVYACAGSDGQLVRMSLADGTVERSFTYCEAMAAHGEDLVVFDSGGTRVARSWTDVRCGDFDELPGSYRNSRFGISGDTLYTAWHSTDTVDVWDLGSGESLYSVTLAGHDGWVDGLDATPDGRLIVNATVRMGRVLVFDDETGTLVDELAVGDGSAGLHCVAGR